MFSVIANMYNKKTKGPSLMELFTATGKPIFFIWQLQTFNVCTTGDTAHSDTIFKFLPHTRVNIGASIFFTATMIRAFRSARSRRRVHCVLCTKCTLHSNHRLTVWYSNTQNDFFPWAAIFSLHTLASPSGRNVNYNEKQLTGGKNFELFLLSIQVL